jgi:hypothetical protein
VLSAWAIVILLWMIANAAVVIAYRIELQKIWREPVFRYPILIIESDDWGAGPLSQATALRDIAAILSRHRDAVGRTPVLNLALVLAVPDGPAIREVGRYRRVCLDAPVFADVLAALQEGRAGGVFALQLHGLEHFWPDALMASEDASVQAWLRQAVPARTEDLPSHLQSRWTNASHLPSAPLVKAAMQAAVAEEVVTYRRVIGVPPSVVVPPTFVWTRETERAWAAQGIECVSTPGWRYTFRSVDGLPAGDEGPIANGDHAFGLNYLSRSDYFEPARGRDARYALAALQRATSMGQPCLLENHRDNFIGDPPTREASLRELDKLCREALLAHADLRFLSSLALARILRRQDQDWLMVGPEKVPMIWMRFRQAGRPRKLMAMATLAAVLSLLLASFG